MNYKDLYEEIHYSLWQHDENEKTQYDDLINEGYLLGLYNPFHTSLTKIPESKNLEVQKLFLKFADKLYLETKDEYVIKLISEFGCYIGESILHGDVCELGGTVEDPEFTLSEYDPTKAVEPEKHKGYKASFEFNDRIEERKFFFKQDAADWLKDFSKNYEFILVNENPLEFNDKDELISKDAGDIVVGRIEKL